MKKNKCRLLYNLRENYPCANKDSPHDICADWDIPETIELLKTGIQSIGLEVESIEIKYPIDLNLFTSKENIISICEMKGSSFRESLIPSLCEIADIPYVFSPPDVMLKSLDKNICNHLVKSLGINVPRWHIVDDEVQLISIKEICNFPYIVKPLHEGSGIGISDDSIVCNADELLRITNESYKNYNQPVLIQEYIDGREVTIGVVGRNNDLESLTPIEMNLEGKKVYGHSAKENSNTAIEVYPITTGKEYVALKQNALLIHRRLGCLDCSRIDFRIDNAGKIYFIEINPLPHLHPHIGDFCRSGFYSGYSYEALLSKVFSTLICN